MSTKLLLYKIFIHPGGDMIKLTISFLRKIFIRLLIFTIIFALSFYYIYFVYPSNIGNVIGQITSPELNEISGVALSSKNPDTLWVHNDSGSSPIIYAISSNGNIKSKFKINANLIDIEDIAILNTIKGDSYIVLSDLGSNTKSRNRSRPSILILEEPCLLNSKLEKVDDDSYELTNWDRYFIDYPKTGELYTNNFIVKILYRNKSSIPDIEALAIDTKHSEIILLSKTYLGISHIFTINLDTLSSEKINLLNHAGSIDLKELYNAKGIDYRHKIFSGINFAHAVTAADISLDQKSLLIRTYGNVWLYNRKNENISFSELITASTPNSIAHPFEAQGEAICFNLDGNAFYTISEGYFPKIYYTEIE